jgi:hypothetical protein
VVDGGAPETLVVAADGSSRLLASARSPTRKVVPRLPAQGIGLEAALGKDPLLSPRDFAELRALAAEVVLRVQPKAAGLPWDIEFGLVHGKAFLMQLRPLRIARAAVTHPFLVALDQAGAAPTAFDLEEALP